MKTCRTNLLFIFLFITATLLASAAVAPSAWACGEPNRTSWIRAEDPLTGWVIVYQDQSGKTEIKKRTSKFDAKMVKLLKENGRRVTKKAQSVLFSVYLKDKWTVGGKLTLNLGVRLSKDSAQKK